MCKVCNADTMIGDVCLNGFMSDDRRCSTAMLNDVPHNPVLSAGRIWTHSESRDPITYVENAAGSKRWLAFDLPLKPAPYTFIEQVGE